jgi:hypothetical protein
LLAKAEKSDANPLPFRLVWLGEYLQVTPSCPVNQRKTPMIDTSEVALSKALEREKRNPIVLVVVLKIED